MTFNSHDLNPPPPTLLDRTLAFLSGLKERVLDALATGIAWVLDQKEEGEAADEERTEAFKRFGIGFSASFAVVLIVIAAMSQTPAEANFEGGSAPEDALMTPSPLPDPHQVVIAVASPEPVSAPAPVAAPVQVASLATDEPDVNQSVHKVRSGDTLAQLLDRAEVSAQQAHEAVTALRDVFNPRKIQAGVAVTLTTAPSDSGADLQFLSFSPEPGRTVSVSRTDDGFSAKDAKERLQRRLVRRAGAIDSSLYEAAMDAGFPQAILADLIMAYSFDVDFQRDIRRNDTFEAMFEQYETADGQVLKTGRILYARMTVGGKPLTLYRYKDSNGDWDYYDSKGKSVRKALLRTPINGARLSSRYGNRRHPVLGYNKMHKGVDFAAPKGTPIYAAGNGVIEMARVYGGYGKYVRIRHNGTYSTAYAHMSGWAKGIKEGRRIKQGQVIGYVGTTGRSTGNHLHYEVLFDNKQMNPLNVKLPSGKTLDGKELARFQGVRDGVDYQLASMKNAAPKDTEVASLSLPR